MRPALKLILITLPVVVAGAFVLGTIITNKPPPARIELAERATAVRVIEARMVALSPRLTGYGLVSPGRSYEAIAQVGGTAEYVNPAMQKGEILPAGTLLLRLSKEDFNLAIAQARANIRAAEARLAELGVSEASQRVALEIEQEALALKTRDLARSQSLFDSQAVSQTVLDGARTAMLAQRQKTQNIESTLALIPTQRIAQNEQIAVYQATLASAELNLARSEFTLPFAARVAQSTVETGQFVKVGQSIASFDGIETAEVEAQVSIKDMSDLLAGARMVDDVSVFDPETMSDVLKGLGIEAVVRLQLGEDFAEWPATLERISNTIDQKSGTLGVIVRVQNAYAGRAARPPLTKGMFVEVVLSAPPVTGLLIPRSALSQGRVLVADEEDRLRILPLTPYLVQDDVALVTEGLPVGSHVLASQPRPAIEGMLLETTLDEALMAQLAGAVK
ncbi:MAG: hypothetical protein L3J37_04665 [Rhodobacteraceae bacterium]|nr:hypothetical protein [Paracoccaceae bacterium]